MQAQFDFDQAKMDFEKKFIHHLLSHSRGNVTEAARRAGMCRVSLIRMMKRYGIKPGKN